MELSIKCWSVQLAGIDVYMYMTRAVNYHLWQPAFPPETTGHQLKKYIKRSLFGLLITLVFIYTGHFFRYTCSFTLNVLRCLEIVKD